MNEFEFTDKNGVIWLLHNNIWLNTKTGRQIPVVQGGKASSSVSPSISPSRSLSPSSSVSPSISPSPSAARNLAETLIDNFNDNSIDTSKWSTFPISGPMMPVETSQRIKLFTVDAQTGTKYAFSKSNPGGIYYDIRGSYYYAKLRNRRGARSDAPSCLCEAGFGQSKQSWGTGDCHASLAMTKKGRG